MTLQQQLESGISHHRAGRLAEAERIYRQILSQHPDHADTLHFMGILAVQMGQLDAGLEWVRRAIANCSTNPAFYNTLGNLFRTKGELDQAIAFYRQAIGIKPDYAEALNNLGNALEGLEQFDEAVETFERAIRIRPDFADAHKNLGNALKRKGRLEKAVAAYRQAIRLKPDLAEAQGNLGIALRNLNQIDEAIAAFRHAVRLRPNLAEGHNDLGDALAKKGQLEAAIACYRQAIQLKPDFAEAHNNLGNALQRKGLFDEGIASFGQAVRIKPDFAEAHTNLGNALAKTGQLDKALACHRHAIRLAPGLVEAHNNLGNVLAGKGKFDEAIASFKEAIHLKPDRAETHYNLGIAFNGDGQLEEAVAAHRRAIALEPGLAEAHNNLGNALKDKGQLDEAIASYRQAVGLEPDLSEAHSNLGNALLGRGEIDGAIALYRQAIRINPDYPPAHSDLVFTLHFHPDYDARMIYEEQRRWHERHGEPLRRLIGPHTNDPNPDRRLRIGYVSPDFHKHVLGRNLLPLLREHDRGQVEIFCYANVVRADALTDQFRRHADVWHNILPLSDSQAVDLIRQDRIDILVDLALHSQGNRLPVFARKPAPVQVTYLGYCAGTGLETIDYRLSDPHLDPVDSDSSVYSERTFLLPETYWCYTTRDATPEPSPSPAASAGYITFGCLNSFAKASLPARDLWAEILKIVPRSRLILHCLPGAHRDVIRQRFEDKGISGDRLEFSGKQPWAHYMGTYGRIDIALDPFPWGGGITTCDAIWMGVPVVSLAGRTAVGRGGKSVLTNMGLTELIAQTPQQYVSVAADLARDLPRLAELRRTLRPRMEASPLMDAPRFARDIEAAYRQMWRNWCGQSGNSGLQSPSE
jgi:protein O-GlcNAc transferase